jgi:hypothetical protein
MAGCREDNDAAKRCPVQLQVSINGGATFADIDGDHSTTLKFRTKVGQSGCLYRAIFTNAVGNSISDPATLLLF